MRDRPASYAKDNVPVPPGMFVVTKFVTSPDALADWRAHFTRKGIATAIVATKSGKYVLCRAGTEANHDRLERQIYQSAKTKRRAAACSG